MESASTKTGNGETLLRLFARAGSIASIGFIALIFIGEAATLRTGNALTSRDVLGLLFFPGGVLAGLILGWRWEGVGGGVTVGSLMAFYALLWAFDGRPPRGPYFILLSLPGFLFLLLALLRRNGQNRATEA